MALNEKDREEIRHTIATALAGSITGRVEHIITDALSAKVGHMQQAQTEAEEKTEQTRQEEGRLREQIVRAQHELEELRAAIKVDRATQAKAMEAGKTQLDAIEERLRLRAQTLAEDEKAAEQAIAASRKHAETVILEHQQAIDAIVKERARLEKGHEEYKRSVGL